MNTIRKYLSDLEIKEIALLFRVCLYLWLIFYYLNLFALANFFWGNESFIPKSLINGILGVRGFNLFGFVIFDQQPKILLFVYIVALIFGLWDLKNKFLPILFLFLEFNFQLRSFYIVDGGNNIIFLMMIYNVFLFFPQKKEWQLLCGKVRSLALLTAQFQVSIMYFIAGTSKLKGELWPNGTALYYTLSNDELTLGAVKILLKIIHPFFLVVPAYFILLYQVGFIFLIWNKRIRKPLLGLGLVFHVSIALIMGLTYFGLALCCIYIIFLDPRGAQTVWKKLIKKRIALIHGLKCRLLSLRAFLKRVDSE